MILCICGHFLRDHKVYFGIYGKGKDTSCSLPDCGCQEYVREGLKKKWEPVKDPYKPITSVKKLQDSLNKTFRRARK